MAKVSGVVFKDLERLQALLIQSGQKGAKEAAKALRNEAQEVLAKARDLVPVDTGALKASGRVVPDTGVFNVGNSVEVWITFGNTAVGYAVYVHEDLTKFHPHGQAKFLEVPLVQQSYGLTSRIADKVERIMKSELR